MAIYITKLEVRDDAGLVVTVIYLKTPKPIDPSTTVTKGDLNRVSLWNSKSPAVTHDSLWTQIRNTFKKSSRRITPTQYPPEPPPRSPKLPNRK